MKFEKYHSIENHYQQKFIDRVLMTVPTNVRWIVTEKVHGANFSFHTSDGNIIRCAKRSGFVDKENGQIEENFFNHGLLKEKYEPAIRKLYAYLMKKQFINAGDAFSIYGEIFGGYYPHELTPKSNTVSMVQSGIAYHPSVEFVAFDVKINGHFVDWQTFETIGTHNYELNSSNAIQFIQPLKICTTLKEALDFDVESLETTIPGYFSLPYLDNSELAKVEGVVIKPETNHYIFDNDRVILKKKTVKFLEKTPINPKTEKVYSEPVLRLIDTAKSYINENRLNNVLSKDGMTLYDVEGKVIGKVIKTFTSDVIQDFMKENKNDFITLEKNEQKEITKVIAGQSAHLIKKLKFGYA